MAVVLVKLTTGTLCLADIPASSQLAAEVAGTTSIAASPDSGGDPGDCVLGEASGCHCNCTHAATVLPDHRLPIGWIDTRASSSSSLPPHPPGFAGALIRPPIA